MYSSKNLALMFLLGALLVGGAVGFTVERIVGDRACEHAENRATMREKLGERLELTTVQRAQLDSILDRRHDEMAAVMAPIRPQMTAIRDRARGEIVKMLTPVQRATFQQLLTEQAEKQRQDSVAAAAAGHR